MGKTASKMCVESLSGNFQQKQNPRVSREIQGKYKMKKKFFCSATWQKQEVGEIQSITHKENQA